MAALDSEEKSRQELANEYLSRFAFCNLASFGLFPQDRYVNLKDTLHGKRRELDAAIRKVYVPPPERMPGMSIVRKVIDKKYVHSNLIADEIEKAAEETKDWQVKTIKTPHAQVLVFTDGDEAQVYFCPTPPMNLRVWLKDFKVVKPANYTTGTGVNCKVHAGFLDVFNEVKDQLRAELTDENGKLKYKHIDVAGYSLGAALSDMFAASLNVEERSHIRQVTTFGDPQAGDSKFTADLSDTIGGKITNIVDNGDIFAHIAKIRFPDFGRPGQDLAVGAPFTNRFDAGGGIVRHLPLAYISSINEWAHRVEYNEDKKSPSPVLTGINPVRRVGWGRQ